MKNQGAAGRLLVIIIASLAAIWLVGCLYGLKRIEDRNAQGDYWLALAGTRAARTVPGMSMFGERVEASTRRSVDKILEGYTDAKLECLKHGLATDVVTGFEDLQRRLSEYAATGTYQEPFLTNIDRYEQMAVTMADDLLRHGRPQDGVSLLEEAAKLNRLSHSGYVEEKFQKVKSDFANLGLGMAGVKYQAMHEIAQGNYSGAVGTATTGAFEAEAANIRKIKGIRVPAVFESYRCEEVPGCYQLLESPEKEIYDSGCIADLAREIPGTIKACGFVLFDASSTVPAGSTRLYHWQKTLSRKEYPETAQNGSGAKVRYGIQSGLCLEVVASDGSVVKKIEAEARVDPPEAVKSVANGPACESSIGWGDPAQGDIIKAAKDQVREILSTKMMKELPKFTFQ